MLCQGLVYPVPIHCVERSPPVFRSDIFSPVDAREKEILARSTSVFDAAILSPIQENGEPHPSTRQLAEKQAQSSTLHHVSSLSAVHGVGPQKSTSPKYLPSPSESRSKTPDAKIVELCMRIPFIHIGATPMVDKLEEGCRLPRAARFSEQEEIECKKHLHNAEMRYRSRMLAQLYVSVELVHGEEAWSIPAKSSLREPVVSTMTLPSFLYRDVGVYMNELYHAIWSLPAGIERDRLVALHKRLDASFQRFLRLMQRSILEAMNGECMQLLVQFSFSPKRVHDVLMCLFMFVQSKRFGERFWGEIEQKFTEAGKRFEEACALLCGKHDEKFWEMCHKSDYYNYASRLRNVARACDKRRAQEPLTDDEKGTLRITEGVNTDFWYDHARSAYFIGGARFGCNQDHIDETHTAIEALVAECLPAHSDLKDDTRSIEIIRYQLETLFNQLALMTVSAKNAVRYGDEIYSDQYTLEKMKDKKVPATNAAGLEKFERIHEMIHIPHTSLMRMVLKSYSVLSYMREVPLEISQRKFLGYGGCEVVIDIDFSKVTKKDLLSSPGCGWVQETIAGFRENFHELTI